MTRLFHPLATMLALSSIYMALHQAQVSAPEPRIASMFAAAGFTLAGKRQTSLGPEFSFTRRDCPEQTRAILTGTIHRNATQALADMAGKGEEVVMVYDGVPVPSLGFRDVAWPWLRRKSAILLGLSSPRAWDSIGLAVFAPRQCPANGLDWSMLVVDIQDPN